MFPAVHGDSRFSPGQWRDTFQRPKSRYGNATVGGLDFDLAAVDDVDLGVGAVHLDRSVGAGGRDRAVGQARHRQVGLSRDADGGLHRVAGTGGDRRVGDPATAPVGVAPHRGFVCSRVLLEQLWNAPVGRACRLPCAPCAQRCPFVRPRFPPRLHVEGSSAGGIRTVAVSRHAGIAQVTDCRRRGWMCRQMPGFADYDSDAGIGIDECIWPSRKKGGTGETRKLTFKFRR